MNIDYEDLVCEYNLGIQDTMRGFTPKFDFLSLWVPDANIIRSILALVESAFSEGVLNFSITMDDHSLQGVDLNKMNEEIAKIAFCNKNYLNGKTVLTINGKAESNHIMGHEIRIHDNYLKKINQYCLLNNHNKRIEAETSCTLLESVEENIQFQLLVDKVKVVKKVGYWGNVQAIHKAIFEVMGELFVGLPLEEVRDEGIARVEYFLRENKFVRTTRGVLHIGNLDRCFCLPGNLLKDACRGLKELNQVNTYNEKVGKKFEGLSDKERYQLIEGYIDKFLGISGLNIKVDIKNIAASGKIDINVITNISSSQKGDFLMKLEPYLRESIDPALQVFSLSSTDGNKNRMSVEG